MFLIDEHRKGWALRYLREARAELFAARETPYIGFGLILEAMRKAQASIYYSFGEPSFIDPIVRQNLVEKRIITDPILRCLVEIEGTVQQAALSDSEIDSDGIKQAEEIIQIASKIVELFTGEKA